MGQVVRAPRYVPKPPHDHPWVGRPKGTSLVLLAALVPAFFLNGTRELQPAEWIGWQRASEPMPLTLRLPPSDAQPFHNPQTFNHVPQPVWQGAPAAVPNVLLQLPALPPFTARPTQKFDLVPPPVWQGSPTPVANALLQLPALPPFTIRLTQKFDHLPEPVWVGRASPAPLAIVLEPATVLPFSNPRRFDHARIEPAFTQVPFAVPVPVLPELPFSNPRRYDHVPQPVWLGTPKPIPNVLSQLPALTIVGARQTQQFNHVPQPVWQGEPVPVSLLFTLSPLLELPFKNRPWQGPIAPPDWVKGGGAMPFVITQIPQAIPPFTAKATRHFEFVQPSFWPGKIGTQKASLNLVLAPNLPAVRNPRLVKEPIYLLEIEAYNPDTLTVETKYYATRTKTTRPDDTPDEVIYWGRMVNAGEINRKMFDNGGTIGAPSINAGYFELNNADGALNYLLDYGIGGRSFTLKWLEDYDDYVTSATTVFIGVLRGIASVDRRKSLQLRVRDKMELLNKQIQTTLYGGSTTGSGATADGDATLLNVAKPKAFGNVLKFTPICANTFDLIYQVSDGAVSLINVYDGGVQLSNDGNYASLALLQAATITAGKFATCLAAGYFRLASAPSFQIISDVEAESSTWAGNQDLYEPGPLAKRVLTSAGFSTGEIDSSFDDLMTVSGAGSYRCGYLVTDTSTTIMDVVSKILGSVGAAITSTADDKFACVVLSTLPLPVNLSAALALTLPPGAPVDTFTAANIGKDASIQLFATRSEEGDGTPVWWINQNYSPYPTTQTRGDLAGSVNDAQALDLAKPFRSTVEFDAAVKTAHPLAQTLTFDSQLTRLIGVNAQAARWLVLYKERRDYLMLTLSMERVDDVQVLDLGDEIALDGVFDYSNKSFYIVGRRDDFAKRQTTLLLFG